MPDLDTLDFVACDDAMRRCGLPFSATEAHAIAFGLFAGCVEDAAAQWHAAVYADLDPNDALAAECRTLLDAVYAVAESQSADTGFNLQLFLPQQSTDYPLVRALRDWAQGFLYGFGVGGEASSRLLSEEGREALQDFYEIAQLDVDESEGGDDAEALMEVEEYIRVAAMLIYEDMHTPLAGGDGASHEIH